MRTRTAAAALRQELPEHRRSAPPPMVYRTPASDHHPASVGRYVLHSALARGGMATVHAAHLVAGEGVTRLVAAKRLHPQYVDDPEFIAMFHDEARIASRIHHPNVVPVVDVVRDGDEVILVQEYVHGVPLSYLAKVALASREPIPVAITLAIMSGILAGLHAAHEAVDELGEPLGIVHRDVSPQNVLISVDGIPRLVDFGIAKAKTSIHHTREGFFKGKLAYMAPEQFRTEPVTRTADLYAAGVLLWELVVNRRFYDGKNDAEFVRAVAVGATPTPTQALEAERESISPERWAQVYLLEPIIVRAMAPSSEVRYATAADMARALAEIAPNAPVSEVAEWVRDMGAEYIEKRERLLASGDERSRISEHVTSAEAGVPSSGARVRLDAMVGRIRSAHARGVSLTAPTAVASRIGRFTREVREMGPWAIVAGLLVVIGMLGAMMIVREPVVVPPSRAPVTPSIVAPRQVVITAAPSTTTRAIAAAPTPTPTPVPPPSPPPPPRIIRYYAPVRVAAPPARTPAPPTASKECSPPYYFEGTTKVFKPGCL